MAELIGGAALGSAFSKVLDAVVYVIGKGITFKSNLNEIQSILNSLKPIVSEIEKLDRELNHPEEETKRLILGLQEGEKLILECLKIKGLKIFTKPYYSKKLIEFEDWLVKIFQTDVQAIQTRDGKKILAKVDEINKKVDEINSKVDGLGLMMTTTTTSSIFERPCEVPGISGCIVGFDVHLRDLKTKLLEDGVQVVVLSAAGGCGKTTLVKMLCSDFEIRGRFGINIFFVTVSKTPNLKLIVENMFRHASFTVPEFQNEDDAINQLGTMLRGLDPAVLLVLDDVWDESESLIQRFMFGITGYKILVASRSEFPKFDSTYKLGILRDPHDMELFCQSAFPQGGSMNIPEDLVREIVRGCGGFPLALYVVGGSLHGQPEVIWTRRRMQLSNESYERQSIFDLNSELLFRLKSSIDALDEKTHVKECFLDLGSFPENQRIRVAALMDMWTELYNLDEDGIYALGNIHELSSRNLVNVELTREDANEIDGYNNEHFVTQHYLLRELAIHQSSQKSVEQREKLIMVIRGNDLPNWSNDNEQKQPTFDACLLSISTDETFSSSWYSMQLPEIEVLILNFRTRNYSLPKFMDKMDRLKVLIITNYGFHSTELSDFQLLGHLSSLKRIRLEHVSISFLSESTLQFRNLRKISLILCKIGETFRNCTVEYTYMFPNLVEIDIHCCSDLVELPEGLCDIICLEKLSITKCNDLDALPQRLGRLTNLEVLRLHSCTGLKGLPDSVGNLHKLRFLDISDCLFRSKLPTRIGELCGLEKLDMRGCQLRQLPQSVKDLGELKEVICDEDTVDLWEPFKIHLNNLKVTVL